MTRLCEQMVAGGTFYQTEPGSVAGDVFTHARNASDVARVRRPQRSSARCLKNAAGPTNNWENPFENAQEAEESCSADACAGRTMYVLPYSMGPVGSQMSQIGVQLTDSPYVVVNMRIMARIGMPVYAEIDKGVKRVVALRTTAWGAPLADGQKRRPVAVQTRKSTSSISRRTARDLVLRIGPTAETRCWARKCFALRIASNIGARRRLDGGAHADPGGSEGFPRAKKTYVRPRPSRAPAAKTNFSMLVPPAKFSRAGRSGPSADDQSPGFKPDKNGRLRRRSIRKSGLLWGRAGQRR